VLLPLLGLSLPAPTAHADPDADPVQVELEVEKKLKRTPRGLRGSVRMTFRNRGDQSVELVYPEIHGLVFRDSTSGELHVLVHPCQCVRDVRHPERAERITLEPGSEVERTLDEFGCSGSAWHPPPRGSYELTYRIHAAAETGTGTGSDGAGASPQDLTRDCRTRYADETYWEGAHRSAPVAVRLR